MMKATPITDDEGLRDIDRLSGRRLPPEHHLRVVPGEGHHGAVDAQLRAGGAHGFRLLRLLRGHCRDCGAHADVSGRCLCVDKWRIAWWIVGGESGPDCRPMRKEWVLELRDRCQAAGVPFFFKQWGGPTPKSGGRLLDGRTWDEMPPLALGGTGA